MNNHEPSINKIPKFSKDHIVYFLRICVCEFIGTFILCFITLFQIAGEIINLTKIEPLVTGMSFIYLSWIFGPISGCQLNPVVTFALFITRRISIVHMLGIWSAQFSGAFFGSFTAFSFYPFNINKFPLIGVVLPSTYLNVVQLFLLEMFGTTIIVLIFISSAEEFRNSIWSGNLFTLFPFVFGITMTLISVIFVSSSFFLI